MVFLSKLQVSENPTRCFPGTPENPKPVLQVGSSWHYFQKDLHRPQGEPQQAKLKMEVKHKGSPFSTHLVAEDLKYWAFTA